jgi:hypothetical protein
MALYVSAARRRRRSIVVGAVALVVGLLVGWLIGRATGSSRMTRSRPAERRR